MPLFSYPDLQQKAGILKISESGRMRKTASQILSESALEFSEGAEYDIFLSHSINDAHLVLALKRDLEKMAYSVYVDWIVDAELDRTKVSRKTAQILRARMDSCRSLFIAHTENSRLSKWVPWELGYFDGLRSRVAILPIVNARSPDESYSGIEYMSLYPYVTRAINQSNNRETLWVHNSEHAWVHFDSWLQGKSPAIHAKVARLLRRL